MNKKILSVILSGVLMLTSAGVFVSCDDYDDDINNLQTQINELKTGSIANVESQLQSLSATVSSLSAATDAIKGLQSSLSGLQTSVSSLEAGIESIRNSFVSKDFLTTTLSSYATTQSVAEMAQELRKAISEAKGEVGEEDLAELQKTIETKIAEAQAAAVKAAGEACEAAFQTKFDAAVSAAGLVSNENLSKAIEDYDAKIKSYITEAITTNEGVISEALGGQIKSAVDDLKKWIAGRLTSVKLIPELYVGGIETIELKSLSYQPWDVTSTASKEEVKQGTTTSTTAASATSVRYNISPSVVTKEDVKDPSFVFEKAETRAAVKDQLLNVDSWNIDDGVLTVGVKKSAGVPLKLDADHVYTAALKVPIADKHLSEGEVGTAVYSDYAALIETTIDPKIAALIDNGNGKSKDGKFECEDPAMHYHFSATYEDAQGSKPSFTQAYNKPIDLLSMVTGCYIENGKAKEITKEAMKAAGLEFRFALPTKPYKEGENATDQQQFASVTNTDGAWTLTSKLPDGTTNNQAAIDKTPIVRVELVDVNNKNAIVDVRYFKIQWLQMKIDPADLKVLKTFDYTLSCNPFTGEFTWKEMVNEVLGKLANNEGMSQSEFLATYTDDPTKIKISATDHKVGDVAKTLTGNVEFAYNFDGNANESAAAFTWQLTTEQIGNVIADLQAGKEVKKVVNVTIPAKNEYQGELTFSFVVNIKLPTLPAINGYDAASWHTDYTLAYVYPVQYNTPDAKSTCEYNYELDRLFADSKPVKNMLPCGKWDLQFAKTQPTTGYTPALTGNKEPAVDNDLTGYTLKKGAVEAVKLNYNNMGNNWYAPATATSGAVNVASEADITLSVENNAAGIGILGQEATLKVWAAINEYNRIELTKFNVYFVEPLKINTELKDAYFVDQVISGSVVDCSKAFTMTDFKDYIVAEKPTGSSEKEMYADKLWKYYGVKATEWDLDNAKTNLKQDAAGNYVVDDAITAETAKILAKDRFGDKCIERKGAELVFQNIRGVKVEKTVKIFVPVTVTHKWGTMTAYVTIELRPE